uniref:Endonuclease n=1 Tax=uncultured marine virus TaxID=186617 RepID=A0A0F7LCF0_9VIRU|nr:endonuclease [uncultured marine virus]
MVLAMLPLEKPFVTCMTMIKIGLLLSALLLSFVVPLLGLLMWLGLLEWIVLSPSPLQPPAPITIQISTGSQLPPR